VPSFQLRTLAACTLPALAVSVSWLRIEQPREIGEAAAIVALALAPALVPAGWLRALMAGGGTLFAVWTAFGAQPWELLPYRDERVLQPTAEAVGRGLADFYRVVLPFSPEATPEMHGLVVVAIFGFVLAVSLLAASSRPVGAAAVTVAGAGWPATILDDGQTVALGALALAAALSTPLILRVRSGTALAAGMAASVLVVAGAAWASSATAVAREAALNWESWDLSGVPAEATGVRFAWDSNYDGIEFPATKTVVLTVQGPERARYWRTSTLDLFASDHWFEDLLWLSRVDGESDAMPLDRLTPARAALKENWLEQRVEVKALVDDRLAAAGTPVALDSRRLGTVFRLSGGVLRVRSALGEGQRYRVWSYAPDPAPAVLASSKPRYPSAALRYLELDGRTFPAFALRGRESVVRGMLADPDYDSFAAYAPLYRTARRIVRSPDNPYAAVLALESWFRHRGGFVYDEQPPRAEGPPLVSFVTKTKAGYCQHYAGAMAVMLRMLGIPARVAVGFTSGKLDEGRWVVTDHEAHAWVEVWFAGQGWVPFDPTPGRATFGSIYSFASDSEDAVAALRRGDLSTKNVFVDRDKPSAAIPREGLSGDRGPSVFAFALGIGALWVLVIGLGKATFRRVRYLTRDPRRAATASRRELEGFLRDQGIEVPACATLDDLRWTVREELGPDGRAFAVAAARARFGPLADSRHGATAARRELRALLRRLRGQLSLWERFRGFVSLRSLRRGWQS
jgi:transglutaminase-like putative cysteine protease